MVDRSGLAFAALDAADLTMTSARAVAAIAGLPSSKADSRDRADSPTLAADDRFEAITPTVLRIDDGAVSAWDDRAGRYASLDLVELVALERGADGAAIGDVMDDLGLDAAVEVSAAIERLAGLGLVTIRVTDRQDPAPPSDQIDPETESIDLAGQGADVDPPAEMAAPREPTLFEGLPPSLGSATRVVAYRASVRAPRAVRRAARTGLYRARERLAAGLDPAGHDAPASPAAHEESLLDSSPQHNVAEGPTREDEPPPIFALESEPKPVIDGTDDGQEPVGPRPWADHRVPVFSVYHSPEHNANLGLGLIVAHARVADGGALNTIFDLRKASIEAGPMLDELRRTGRPAVVLFSDYMWSVTHNLAVSAEVKELSPDSVTIHGGPHAPSYPGDAETFLERHPEVDVLVRGEGEATIAELLAVLGSSPAETLRDGRLRDVAGLTYRQPGADGIVVVRTADRARTADIECFPSPYLTGEFSEIDPARWRSATVETNRGCPYGCTFCDWGQATLARIRQFPLDRVFAELEWIAARGISEVFLSDANFGIYARDVEIAQRIADLHARYGAPRQVICSFAKNTVKYTTEIVRIWVEAGICAEGSVALQTTDPATLENVARTNIKIEKYDALAEEFRRHRLPIVTDLLMGLPGATVESFKADLQRCLDHDVTPRMMETVVLPNSPMNDPAYRERFSIETDDADIVVATSSYTRTDFDEMKRLRLLFRAFEHFGLLRHLFRWLQIEHGVRALDLIHEIDRAIIADPSRYPLLTWVGRYFDLVTVPPGGWPPFYDEVADLLGDRYGLSGDPGMLTVLRLQAFLMPRRGRRFPERLTLDHDYVSWLEHHRNGRAGRRLAEFGPAEVAVDDPIGVCEGRLVRNGFSIRREEACDNPFWVLNDWELDSVLARPMATAVPFMTP